MAAIGARARALIKRTTLAAGRVAPEPVVGAAHKLSGWLEIGRWLRDECAGGPRRPAQDCRPRDLMRALADMPVG